MENKQKLQSVEYADGSRNMIQFFRHQQTIIRKNAMRCRPILAMLIFLFPLFTPGQVPAANPGETDPIVPTARRMLFPDQHALIALPADPGSSQNAVTYTDWARSANLKSMLFQESFAALQGLDQARSAAGHILSERTEQVAVGRFIGSGTDNTIQVDILTPEGQITSGASAQISAFSTSALFAAPTIESFGVAAGDLNLLIDDEEGMDPAEVVTCHYVEQDFGNNQVAWIPTVTVLDYTDWQKSGVIQTSASANGAIFDFTDVPRQLVLDRGSDSLLSCATGDLNGDGVDEIIVGAIRGITKVDVTVLSYTYDGQNPPAIERLATITLDPMRNPNPFGNGLSGSDARFWGSIDLTTGDFNGDGRLEVGVAVVNNQQSLGSLSNNRFPTYPVVYVISSDSNFNLTLSSTFANLQAALTSDPNFRNGTGSYACRTSPYRQACESTRAGLEAGLFKYDPGSGFDFDRRQLAVVYNMPYEQGGGLRVQALEVSSDLKTISPLGDPVTLPQQTCATEFCPSSPRFSLSAGGFVGAGNLENPTWSLMVGNWEATQQGNGNGNAMGQSHAFWLQPSSAVNGNGLSTIWDAVLLNGEQISGPSNGRLPTVAWDREGKSVWLGSPVHMVVYDLIKPQYVIEEPPKHTYWWPPGATNPADGQIFDVSRKWGFYVELSDETALDYSFTHKDQTDWTIGGSVAVTAKASVTKGVDAGILGSAKATASLEVKGKVGYDYNENSESYNSDYRSQTTTFTGQTNADDLLIADLTRIDIWRYPVSGIDVEDGLNAFWEIAFPGDAISARGGGLRFDWYTPQHENGNILSYPRLTGNTFTPQDCCAEFTFLDNSKPVTEQAPFLNPILLAWDGTSKTINLEFSEKSGEGSTKSYTNKLQESLDVKVGYKTEAKSPGGVGSVKAETSVDVNVHNSNSWADVDTTTASTNNSTGFKLVKQVGNSGQSYDFMPQFYLAKDGTTKVSYAVNPLGTGVTFWPNLYGQLPDPALNLPRRFNPTTPVQKDEIVWVINTEDDAKRMRGFFVRYNTANEADGFPLVAGAVTDGEVIRLDADVYNYSLGQGVAGLNVAYQAVQYNPVTNREIGNPVTLNCGSGSITTLAINPRDKRTATCIWNTMGFGSNVPGGIQYYRIYVTLDPNNQIEELYEGTVGPGQNNQGWGLVGVANPQETFRTPVATDAIPNGADVSITENGLEILVNGQLTDGPTHVFREQHTPLRVCASTDQTQTGYHHVLIWNGDPENGGTLLADKMLPGIDRSGDSCVWLPEFRLEDTGLQTLSAQLLETESDGLRGNAYDTLQVMVDDIPTPALKMADGFATRVGTRHDRGELRLGATFAYSQDLDLSVAQLVIDSLLEETEGAGELIPGVKAQTGQSLVLQPSRTTRHEAFFSTPDGVSPKVSAHLHAAHNRLRLDLRVRGAEILEPESCGKHTELTTNLVMLDDTHAPEDLRITKHWRCMRDKRGDVSNLVLVSRGRK